MEYHKNLMKRIGKTKAKGFSKDGNDDWETDFEFYLDEYYRGERKQQLRIVDKQPSSKERLVLHKIPSSSSQVETIDQEVIGVVLSEDSQLDVSDNEFVGHVTPKTTKDDMIHLALSRKALF